MGIHKTMVELKRLIIFFAVAICVQGVELSQPQNRDSRLFSLFNVISFPNNPCTATSGDTGTCFTAEECSDKGGSIYGNCASGFGVCCTFTVSSCSSTVSQNCTYIQNPGYPSAYTASSDTSCEYSVKPMNSQICQLRLDFSSFDLAETSTTGACVDSFTVSVGSSRTYPTICGTLSGQHIYLETGRSTSSQTLKFTVKATTGSVTLKAKVSQIECDSMYKAPSDCYQYYTGTSGTITSFNWGSGDQIQSMSYTACIKRMPGMCGVEWAVTQGSSTDAFEVSTESPETAKTGGTTATGENAYIALPGSDDDYYSGDHFAYSYTIAQASDSTIIASGQRFLLEVYAKASDQGVGFSLDYLQVGCNKAMSASG